VGPDAYFGGGGFYAFDGEFGQVGQEGAEVVVVMAVHRVGVAVGSEHESAGVDAPTK
jgi:hypothetical protein